VAEHRIEITLAKALKLKNRLAGRVGQLSQDMKAYNSSLEGAEVVDVLQRYAERAALVARLVELKTAITRANQPVQRAIYTLAERKALLSLLGELNTHHGTVTHFHQPPVRYVAQLRKEQVDQERRRLEEEIDRLQEELDRFNQATVLAVDAALVAEPGADSPHVA
jgi:hypothetical protein